MKDMTVIPLRGSKIAQHAEMPGSVLLLFSGDREDSFCFSISPEDLAVLAEQFAAAASAMIDGHLKQ